MNSLVLAVAPLLKYDFRRLEMNFPHVTGSNKHFTGLQLFDGQGHDRAAWLIARSRTKRRSHTRSWLKPSRLKHVVLC